MGHMLRIALALLLVAVPQEPAPRVLEAGPLTCEIHISRTAHLFHVVDQLSEWSEHCHSQYGRHFKRGITSFDRDALDAHVKVRKQRGWGEGLEQTFYSPLDLEGAIKVGLEKKHLDAVQAEVERMVLAHFGPRVDALIADNRKLLESYADRL